MLDLTFFFCLPCLLTVGVLATDMEPGKMADFRVFWGAGRDILSGHGGDFIYPPPIALSMVPLSLLPFHAAAVIWFVVLVASGVGLLYTLGIRDWRCYGVTLLGAPTLAVLGSGAISSLLALGAAVTWRYRDRPKVAGPVLALVVVAKIFMWPLLIWLAATNRWRGFRAVVVWCFVLIVAGWAAIGFAGFDHYPRKLLSTTSLEQGNGYSPMALALALHIPATVARVLSSVVLLGLLAGIVALARRPGGDRRAFALAIVATLAATPISWLHYYVLLLVPIALFSRSLAPVWFLPLGFWLCSMGSNGDLRKIVTATALTILITTVVLRPEMRRPSSLALEL